MCDFMIGGQIRTVILSGAQRSRRICYLNGVYGYQMLRQPIGFLSMTWCSSTFTFEVTHHVLNNNHSMITGQVERVYDRFS